MENSSFRRLGTMIDCSRNAVMRPEAVCRWAKLTRELGYNMLMLYTEDTYEVDGQPYFGYGRGRYTKQELKDMDAYCRSIGMELMPCIQTLAHLDNIIRWKTFQPYIDTANILLIDDERTYELIDGMFRTLSECFTSRIVNIGMDEAHMVGRGRYLDQHGPCNRPELLLKHLERVAQIAAKYGFTMVMWSDMFFRLTNGGAYYGYDPVIDPVFASRVPENVQLIYWDYYSVDRARYDGMLAAHKKIKPGAWFAGGLWTWRGFAPHNRFSIESTKVAFASCRAAGVQDVFLTMWGDNGGECSRFSMLPALYCTAQLAQGVEDEAVMAEGFREKFGISMEDFLLLDLPGTGNDVGSCNADKYLLYNDIFTGLLDCTLKGGEGEGYRICADRLAGVQAGEFAPQFQTAEALCRVLERKAELGQRTRAAYAADDRTALTALLADYDALLPLLERFYDAFRAQWLGENKPQGFEVQDVRLGGLMQRVRSCRRTLTEYLEGKTASIEELEQPLLDVREGGETFGKQPIEFNTWSRMVSASHIG